MKSKELLGYTVVEPTVGVMFPLMKIMESDPQKFQLELAKSAIHKDGVALGEGINDIGISDYMKLMNAVMEVSGFADATAGND